MDQSTVMELTFSFPAHGIIVPLLRHADDARKLVQSAKFPPAGQRGFGSPFPMEKFGGQTSAEYLQQANESLLTIVQIETKEALQNVCLAFRNVPTFQFKKNLLLIR